MPSLDTILAFRTMMPYLSEDERNNLATTLGMSLGEINQRLIGKNKEDEFVLILLLMDVCKSITGFDEGVSKLLSTATSDLLIELKTGRKFMLEIKHTDKEKYTISGGNLKKRIEYAKGYGLDLYFAISIMGFWMLFNAEYLQQKNGKIDVSDMLKSELDNVLKCFSYIFPSALKIKSVYSKNTSKGMGIRFDDYGELISYELLYQNRRIFRAKGKKSQYIGYTMILEALQDRLSMNKQDITQSGELTIITEEFTNDFNAISEYKFLLAPVEHTVHSGTNRYTAHEYLEEYKEDKSKFRFQLGHIRGVMQELANRGVPIMYSRDNLIYKLEPDKK